MTIQAKQFTTTILNGATAGSAFVVDPQTVHIGIITPGTLTGTISLQISLDGGSTWRNIFSGITSGAQGSTSEQNKVFIQQPGVQIRLLSSAAEAADRTFTICTIGNY